jgi:tRNA pseudouridine38-40 synthase
VRTLKLTLAYDGTDYVGWQRQTNGLSIQQLVEEAFVPLAGVAPTVAGASRTDAGAHALGQVASVTLDVEYSAPAIQRALNIRLPSDIRVIGSVDASPGFHARSHATGKTYRYRMATTEVLSPFDRRYVWHAPERRDVDAMRAASAAFRGRHDFASFQARGSSILDTIRTITRVDLFERPGELVFEVDGDGFLRHMVRAMVGTLAEVGTGLRPVESIAAMIAARDRRSAGATAPASGLTLVSVKY